MYLYTLAVCAYHMAERFSRDFNLAGWYMDQSATLNSVKCLYKLCKVYVCPPLKCLGMSESVCSSVHVKYMLGVTYGNSAR